MNIKKLILLLFVLFGTAFSLQAQSRVSGQVKDVKTGETLPGVNITIKGMPTRGTSTDSDGNYTLTVPSMQDTLIFSFIGYVKKEVPVNNNSQIDVSLSAEVSQLEDVVVIGYGTQKKEDNTGSISSVSAKDFNDGAITSPQELFQGKAAGVTVTSGDGAPGSGATIRIRGGSSLSASNAPLYVVDGVPLDGEGVSGMRNPLNTINPNDIESISILKDASATAIYGSRASNGVVIISTKKGHEGQELSVNYTGKVSYQTQKDHIAVLGAEEFKNVISNQFGNIGTQYLGSANTNWQDQIYENVYNQDHNLSITGAYNKLPYRLSVGFSDDSGILRTSNLDRLTGSLALNPTLLDDDLKINLNLKGVQVKNRFANRGAIGSALRFDPTKPVKVDSSNAPFASYYTWVDQHNDRIPIAPSNPVALLDQTFDKSTVYRSIGNLKLDYALPFINSLRAKLNLGYDYSKVGNGTKRVPVTAAFATTGNSLARGELSNYTQLKKNQLLDFYLNYNKDIPSINSTFNLTGGYSWEHHFRKGTNYSTNFNRQDTLKVNQDTDYKSEYYIVSFFGRLNYTLSDKYLLTATLREDGTSRFSKENRWGLFPSVALAWKLGQEPFLRNSDALTELKLRLGYGVTGQQRIGQGDYPYLAQYTASEPNARYQFGNQFITTLRPEGYNANLKWEETTTYNAGIDYGFFNERLFGSIDAYYRQTNDLLNVIPVPAGTNFTNRILSNVGTLDVRGLEFSVTGRVISTQDTYLEVGFNAARNENEITKLTTVQSDDYIGVETGGISGGTGNTIQIHSIGHPRNSFYVYEQAYDANGKPLEGVYVDRNGDGSITVDDKYRYKDPSADYTLGLSSRLEYKQFDASFSLRANLNNYVYNNVASGNGFYSDMFYQNYIRNAPESINNTNFQNERFFSDYYVEDASFLRMDNITVGYTIPELLNSLESVRFSATVQNVFVITNYSGLDPEVFGGIDNNVYPRPRTFVLGLSLNF